MWKIKEMESYREGKREKKRRRETRIKNEAAIMEKNILLHRSSNPKTTPRPAIINQLNQSLSITYPLLTAGICSKN